MRLPLTRIAAALAGLALLASCSPSQDAPTVAEPQPAETGFPVTVTHASGETTIDSKPERIVVLDMAALDTIDAIGAGDRVVGTPTRSVPTWLRDDDGIDYTTATDVGTLIEPDLEAIAKLNPDLVVVGARTSAMYPEFAKNFTTIDHSISWDADSYSVRIPASIEMLGEATGETEGAAQAAKGVTDAIEKYRGKGEGLGTATVLMTNAGEISLHGVKSRWAPIFDVFGFEPASDQAADDGHKGDKISFETVKEMNPGWLFVVDRDAAVGSTEAGTTAEQVLDNELVNSTDAAKNSRIVYLSPERWYIVMTGANNFVAMLDEVNEAVTAAS